MNETKYVWGLSCWQNLPQCYELVSETDHTVTLAFGRHTRRRNKVSDHESFYPTFAEAKQARIDRLNRELQRLAKAVADAQERLNAIEALTEPPSPSTNTVVTG